MNALIKSDLLEPGNGAQLKSVVAIAKALVPKYVGSFRSFEMSSSGNNTPGVLEISSKNNEVLLSVVAVSGETYSATFKNGTAADAVQIVLAVAEEL